jgi:hypothetical protein
MSTVRQRRGELWVLMQLRRFGFGHNPLRRRVDRIEAAVLISALVVALLAIPAAAILGTTVRDRSEDAAARQRAVIHQVQARTLEDTAEAVPSVSGQVVSQVRIAWSDASGLLRESRTDVLIGTRAGTPVTIWLDRSGALARAPREPGDSAALGAAVGLALPMLAWPFLWGTFWLVHHSLDRRRAEQWTREWKRVSARWTGKS